MTTHSLPRDYVHDDLITDDNNIINVYSTKIRFETKDVIKLRFIYFIFDDHRKYSLTWRI